MSAPEPTNRHHELDVRSLILEDLERERRRRGRYYLPALLLAILSLAAPLAMTGLRPDLWTQPPLAIGLQLVQWAVCLLAFPAIGLGLWFPRREVRAALALLGVALVASATVQVRPMGPSPTQRLTEALADPCLVVVALLGSVLMLIVVFSGAYGEQRRRSSVFWLAGGIALAALNSITWHCPASDATHVLVSHVGAAGIVLGLVGGGALWLRRLQRDVETSDAPDPDGT